MPQDQPDNLKLPVAPSPVVGTAGGESVAASPLPQPGLPSSQGSGGQDATSVSVATTDDEDGPDVFDFIMDSFAALPEPVRRYLNSEGTSASVTRAFDEAGLNLEERDFAYTLLLQVFFGLVVMADFADELKRGLDWPADQEDRAHRLAVSLMGHVMLPAQAFLGNIVGLIVALGGDPDDFTEPPIEIRNVSFMEGTQTIADQVPMDLIPAERARLRHIIEARLRDVRDDLETKAMLMRPKKVGGLEMGDASAEKVMETIRSEVRLTKFVETTASVPAATATALKPAVAGDAVLAPSSSVTETPVPAARVLEPAVQPSPAGELDAKAIKALYLGSDEERSRVAKRIAKFREVTGDDSVKQRDAFYEILYPPDLGPVEPLFVVAGALAMAEDGTLVPALTDDLRFQDIVSKYLVDRHLTGQSFRFSESPSDPEFMNIFLQLLLRGFAELSGNEAARFGLRVVNAAKKAGFGGYSGLVAFDADECAFRWLEPIEL